MSRIDAKTSVSSLAHDFSYVAAAPIAGTVEVSSMHVAVPEIRVAITSKIDGVINLRYVPKDSRPSDDDATFQ